MRELIQSHMILNHIKSAQMAKCFGISERTWRYWLEDPERRLTVERIKAIANILGFSEEERRKVWLS